MKRFLFATLTILALLTTSLSCSSAGESLETIRVAHAQFESTALLCIAQDQQFFRQNGLNVTIEKHDTGAGALDSMLNGDADIAVGTSAFPLVRRVFQGEKMRVIGSIARAEFIFLIARKDHGIEEVPDLKGKTVGTALGTVAEFYLSRFLTLNGLDAQEDITLVDLPTPQEWVNAIADGEIDAVAIAQPHAKIIEDQLGANAAVWSAQSNQPMYSLLIAGDAWVSEHPDLIRRFLKALAQAEAYLIRNPAEAKAIVQRQLNLDADYMDSVWKQNQFSLFLDQSLILVMEDEARWMIKNDPTTEMQMPNFLDFIYEDGLKAVKPHAVNILR